jgi:sulfite reductase (NADPH) flavoprotein alpha-component
LCPRNDPDQVRQLLRAFNLRGNETILRNNRSGPAWRILLEDVAIGSISNAFREALREQITTRDKGLIIDEYIRAAKPNLVALLRHFPTLGKCFEEFVEHSEPLLPQKGCVVKSLNVRDNQLRVLLPESVHRGNASGCVPLETGAWVPVYIEQRDTAHVSDNGELPLIIVTDPFCAQVAVSYLAERQQLGHRGRTWIVVFGSHIDQTLRSDLEQLQLSGSLTRVDFALEVAPNNTPPLQFSSPMFWRWFVDRSAFHVVGVDNPSTMELERSILDALVTSSGKAADWFVEPLMERRASGLYRTMTLV